MPRLARRGRCRRPRFCKRPAPLFCALASPLPLKNRACITYTIVPTDGPICWAFANRFVYVISARRLKGCGSDRVKRLVPPRHVCTGRVVLWPVPLGAHKPLLGLHLGMIVYVPVQVVDAIVEPANLGRESCSRLPSCGHSAARFQQDRIIAGSSDPAADQLILVLRVPSCR